MGGHSFEDLLLAVPRPKTEAREPYAQARNSLWTSLEILRPLYLQKQIYPKWREARSKVGSRGHSHYRPQLMVDSTTPGFALA
jgi:hypothetical protein